MDRQSQNVRGSINPTTQQQQQGTNNDQRQQNAQPPPFTLQSLIEQSRRFPPGFSQMPPAPAQGLPPPHFILQLAQFSSPLYSFHQEYAPQTAQPMAGGAPGVPFNLAAAPFLQQYGNQNKAPTAQHVQQQYPSAQHMNRTVQSTSSAHPIAGVHASNPLYHPQAFSGPPRPSFTPNPAHFNAGSPHSSASGLNSQVPNRNQAGGTGASSSSTAAQLANQQAKRGAKKKQQPQQYQQQHTAQQPQQRGRSASTSRAGEGNKRGPKTNQTSAASQSSQRQTNSRAQSKSQTARDTAGRPRGGSRGANQQQKSRRSQRSQQQDGANSSSSKRSRSAPASVATTRRSSGLQFAGMSYLNKLSNNTWRSFKAPPTAAYLFSRQIVGSRAKINAPQYINEEGITTNGDYNDASEVEYTPITSNTGLSTPLAHYAKHFREVKELRGHTQEVYCVAFDKTGKLIITGSDDGLVKIWSADTGYLLRTLMGHTGDIMDIAVSADNKLLATAANDNTIRVWSLPEGRSLHVLHGHTEAVTSVNFCPNMSGNGNLHHILMSTSADSVVRLWDLDDPEQNYLEIVGLSAAANKDFIRGCFNKQGTLFAFLTLDNNIVVCSLTRETYHRQSEKTTTTSAATATAAEASTSGSSSVQSKAQDSDFLLSTESIGSDAPMLDVDTAVPKVDTTTAVTQEPSSTDSEMLDIESLLSDKKPTGESVDQASESSAVALPQTDSESIPAPTPSSTSSADAPQQEEAATEPQQQQQPNITEQQRANETRQQQSEYHSTATVNRFKVSRVCVFTGHEATVTYFCFNNAGDRIVSGDKQENVNVWDAKTAKLKYRLTSPTPPAAAATAANTDKKAIKPCSEITMLLWSLDDRYLITAGHRPRKTEVKVWDASTGKLLRNLRNGHKAGRQIYVLSAHPTDKRMVMSAGYDGKICVWDIVCGELLKEFNKNDEICDGVFSPRGDMIVTTDKQSRLTIFELVHSEGVNTAPADDGYIYSHPTKPLVPNAASSRRQTANQNASTSAAAATASGDVIKAYDKYAFVPNNQFFKFEFMTNDMPEDISTLPRILCNNEGIAYDHQPYEENQESTTPSRTRYPVRINKQAIASTLLDVVNSMLEINADDAAGAEASSEDPDWDDQGDADALEYSSGVDEPRNRYQHTNGDLRRRTGGQSTRRRPTGARNDDVGYDDEDEYFERTRGKLSGQRQRALSAKKQQQIQQQRQQRSKRRSTRSDELYGWLLRRKQRAHKYIPQIGDSVVVCKAAYKRHVKRMGGEPLPESFPPVFKAVIQDIRYRAPTRDEGKFAVCELVLNGCEPKCPLPAQNSNSDATTSLIRTKSTNPLNIDRVVDYVSQFLFVHRRSSRTKLSCSKYQQQSAVKDADESSDPIQIDDDNQTLQLSFPSTSKSEETSTTSVDMDNSAVVINTPMSSLFTGSQHAKEFDTVSETPIPSAASTVPPTANGTASDSLFEMTAETSATVNTNSESVPTNSDTVTQQPPSQIEIKAPSPTAYDFKAFSGAPLALPSVVLALREFSQETDFLVLESVYDSARTQRFTSDQRVNLWYESFEDGRIGGYYHEAKINRSDLSRMWESVQIIEVFPDSSSSTEEESESSSEEELSDEDGKRSNSEETKRAPRRKKEKKSITVIAKRYPNGKVLKKRLSWVSPWELAGSDHFDDQSSDSSSSAEEEATTEQQLQPVVAETSVPSTSASAANEAPQTTTDVSMSDTNETTTAEKAAEKQPAQQQTFGIVPLAVNDAATVVNAEAWLDNINKAIAAFPVFATQSYVPITKQQQQQQQNVVAIPVSKLKKLIYPMSLKTIRDRLRNNYYRRERAILHDLRIIRDNLRVAYATDSPLHGEYHRLLTLLSLDMDFLMHSNLDDANTYAQLTAAQQQKAEQMETRRREKAAKRQQQLIDAKNSDSGSETFRRGSASATHNAMLAELFNSDEGTDSASRRKRKFVVDSTASKDTQVSYSVRRSQHDDRSGDDSESNRQRRHNDSEAAKRLSDAYKNSRKHRFFNRDAANNNNGNASSSVVDGRQQKSRDSNTDIDEDTLMVLAGVRRAATLKSQKQLQKKHRHNYALLSDEDISSSSDTDFNPRDDDTAAATTEDYEAYGNDDDYYLSRRSRRSAHRRSRGRSLRSSRGFASDDDTNSGLSRYTSSFTSEDEEADEDDYTTESGDSEDSDRIVEIHSPIRRKADESSSLFTADSATTAATEQQSVNTETNNEEPANTSTTAVDLPAELPKPTTNFKQISIGWNETSSPNGQIEVRKVKVADQQKSQQQQQQQQPSKSKSRQTKTPTEVRRKSSVTASSIVSIEQRRVTRQQHKAKDNLDTLTSVMMINEADEAAALSLLSSAHRIMHHSGSKRAREDKSTDDDADDSHFVDRERDSLSAAATSSAGDDEAALLAAALSMSSAASTSASTSRAQQRRKNRRRTQLQSDEDDGDSSVKKTTRAKRKQQKDSEAEEELPTAIRKLSDAAISLDAESESQAAQATTSTAAAVAAEDVAENPNMTPSRRRKRRNRTSLAAATTTAPAAADTNTTADEEEDNSDNDKKQQQSDSAVVVSNATTPRERHRKKLRRSLQSDLTTTTDTVTAEEEPHTADDDDDNDEEKQTASQIATSKSARKRRRSTAAARAQQTNDDEEAEAEAETGTRRRMRRSTKRSRRTQSDESSDNTKSESEDNSSDASANEQKKTANKRKQQKKQRKVAEKSDTSDNATATATEEEEAETVHNSLSSDDQHKSTTTKRSAKRKAAANKRSDSIVDILTDAPTTAALYSDFIAFGGSRQTRARARKEEEIIKAVVAESVRDAASPSSPSAAPSKRKLLKQFAHKSQQSAAAKSKAKAKAKRKTASKKRSKHESNSESSSSSSSSNEDSDNSSSSSSSESQSPQPTVEKNDNNNSNESNESSGINSNNNNNTAGASAGRKRKKRLSTAATNEQQPQQQQTEQDSESLSATTTVATEAETSEPMAIADDVMNTDTDAAATQRLEPSTTMSTTATVAADLSL